MSISSKELAALLNVSPSAVSIALNGREGISEKKRAMILRAAEEYGLRHTSRKSTKSSIISLVIFKKHGMVYGDTPFFSAVIEGISAEATKANYNLQITYFYGNQDLNEQIKMLSMSDCAGIILLATEMTEEDIRPFNTLPQPVVVLDSYFEEMPFSSVVINNVQGAYLATRYLIDSGHCRLGYLHSKVEINNFEERREGFLKAINSLPAECHCSYEVIPVGSTQDSAYHDMFDYLSTSPSLPTALFADNDIIAISCIRALKEYGYRIPEDISIVGFDDMPMAYVTSPKLTTIHVPKENLGGCAISTLLTKIQEGHSAPTMKTCMNTSLVVRNTVKSLPNESKP